MTKTLTHLIPCALILFSFSAFAGKPLVERLLNIDDPGYNDALSEMQDLQPDKKIKISAELAKIMKTRKPDQERSNAASALGDLCGEVKDNSKHLLSGLKDKSKYVRQASTSGLRRCGAPTPEVAKGVIGVLNDIDEATRANAMSVLADFGPAAKDAVPALAKALKDKNESVRSLAKMALESIGTAEAKAALVSAPAGK